MLLKQVINSTSYVDVVEFNGDSTSFSKESIKKVRLTDEAVYLELIDDIPYFLNYKIIENLATPGLPFSSALELYLYVLDCLII